MSQDEHDDPTMHKERETKDDGRYIIFYTFEEAPEEKTQKTLRDEGRPA